MVLYIFLREKGRSFFKYKLQFICHCYHFHQRLDTKSIWIEHMTFLNTRSLAKENNILDASS